MKYMQSLTKYKVLVDPKVTVYFNKTMHEFAQNMFMNLSSVIKTCDQHLQNINFNRDMQNMIALHVQAPKTVYDKSRSRRQLQKYLHKLNQTFADDSFAKSSDYKSLSKMLDSQYNKSAPKYRQFTKFRLIKTIIPIDTCLINLRQGNKISPKTAFNVGKLAHIIFEFKTQSGEYRAFFPIDLPMTKHMINEKHQLTGPTKSSSKSKKSVKK